MYGNNATLYPMLAVGAFMSAFWTGIVVGNEMGLGCVSLLMLGLLSAFTASVGVCELQRRAERGCACPRAHVVRRQAVRGGASRQRPAVQSPRPPQPAAGGPLGAPAP